MGLPVGLQGVDDLQQEASCPYMHVCKAVKGKGKARGGRRGVRDEPPAQKISSPLPQLAE